MAQPMAPLYPPMLRPDTRFVLQIQVNEIDGARSGLTEDRGFRRFVQRRCTEYGLSGFVWRVPRVHGKILACGLPAQLDQLLVFVEDLRIHGFIKSYMIDERHDFRIAANTFSVLPSTRRHVITGVYSDAQLDDVVSRDSASDTPVANSPVPVHLGQAESPR
jgi:acylphosphatase